MQLSPKEKASNRAAFRAMSLGQKAEYVFAYYKLPLVLILIAAVALGSVAHRLLTHKEPVLYLAYANVVPSDEVDQTLTSSFVSHQGMSPRRSEVVSYHDLYVSRDDSQQNHQYAYASRLKLMAAIDAEQLDVALMNQEAYDLLSGSGYLLDLSEAGLPDAAQERLTSNTVILADNSVEVELGEADAYEAETIEQVNALEVTGLSLLSDLPEDEALYLGIIANTPRLKRACAYLGYVLGLA